MIDSHCHIAGSEFTADLEAVIDRARHAGLRHALVILEGHDQAELARAADVLARWPEVRFSVGVHPQTAGAFADDPGAAARAVDAAIGSLPAVRALGEIGLDYHYEHASRAVQQDVFRQQIRLARTRALPIVIHTRDADEDTFRILAEERAGEVGGLFHCFTGTVDTAMRALELGFDISISGIVSFAKALDIKAVARAIPLDRLHVETDSPFLAPVPYRGRRNEPAYVIRVIETIAELRGTSPMAVGGAALANFERLFKP